MTFTKAEILVTCPLCRKHGFTARGLRAHFCPATVCFPGTMKQRLTEQQWQAAVDAAQVAALKGEVK